MPILLNLTTGLFIIPPTNRVLKIARHAYGYLNPATGSSPLPCSPTAPAPQVVSQPLTHLTVPSLSIPKEGADDLRRAVCEMVPLPGLAERPFTKTRLCWYSDTPTGDFLIDYHPQWKGLFVATGDSGHAFKFLPVIGDKIADCIMGNCPAEFRAKWAWKPAAPVVITEDGSRGGKPGLILAEELAVAATH
jgi:sarcosine oxidase / L-pipecolate oxidase